MGFVLYIYSNNNTLTNNNASNNLVGFQIQSSSNNTVFNNTAYNNAWDGFVFSWSSDNNTVFNNSASNSAMGFELYSSSNNLLANNTASNSNTDGFDLEYSSNYNILTNNSAWNNNQGFNLYTSNYNTFTNNSAFNNSGTGFYMSVCSNNNLTSNSAWQNVYGFSLMYSSNYNNLINNTAYNNTNVGFSLSSNYNNIINNSAYNNSGDGFFIAYYSDYNNITGNTAYNDVNGIFLYGSNNILSNNTVHNNYYGIDLIYSAYNNLTNNTAYNNSQDGFYLGTSDYVNLTNNSAYNNSQYGFYIYSSDAANLTDCHAYNNTLGEFRASTDSTPRIFYANNLTIDNPYGNMANYTSLNITDTLAAGNDYIIKWAANPSALPGQATSFRGKYIDISIVSGSASIDSITWTWADSELGGYNEDLFKLVKYNASGWSYVPGQQLYAAQNTLNVSNLDSFSTFAILEYTTNVSVLKLNQTAQQPSPGGTVQFNITATNTGNITLNTEVWDVLPENLTFSNSYPPYDSTVPPRRYSWALSLSPGETRAIYLNATVNPGAVDSANPIVTLPNYANATGTSAVSAPVFEESTANVTIYYANASTVKVNLTAQIASQGGMVQYLINVTNTGNVSLNITVNDTLDNALKYNSSSDSGISTLQNVVWTLTGVTPGQTRQLYLNATVRNYPSQCQNTTNSLNVLGIPPNGDNVTATTSLIVPVCLANAVIKLDQTAAQPSPGGMVNFQLNITNTGNVTLSPVTLVDTLPPGLDYFNANWTPIIAGGTLTWNDIGPINPGETIIILLNATVNDSATATQCTVTLTNNINVEGQPPNGENATASDSKNVVVKCANISVIKINQAIAEPSPGGQVRFRINITNSGNVTLDTSVWDNMPENLTISGIYPAYNSTMPPRAYQWNFALSPGQTEFIYINATVDLGAVSELNPIVTLTNYVNATGTPPNGNSVFSEDSENVDVHYANVSILKIDITPFPPSQGGIVQYYIVATNTGNITLNPLEITDTLPTGFTFNSTNTSGYYLSGQDVIWGNVGPLSSGSSITILLNASVDEGTSSGAYTNTVNAQGTPPNGKDVFASGNATVGVNSSAINIVKTASNYSAVIGDNITFILNITNSGEINLTTFARDVLPAGVSFLAAIPAPDSVVGQELYWNSIGILQPGEYFEITYNISIASGGDKTNNAVATGVPPNGENATDSGSVTINVQSPYHEEHEPHEKFECITSYDCKECYTCRSNKCEILPGMCAQDSDCTQYGEGYYCDSCVCMHPECLEDSDCAKGFTCVNYVCVPPECWNDSDCREGLICDSFKCKEKPVEKPPWPEQKPISEVPVEPEKKPPLVVPETPKPVEVVQTNVPLVEEVGQQKPVSTSSDAIVYAIGGGVVVVLVLITYVFFKRKHKPTKGEAIE